MVSEAKIKGLLAKYNDPSTSAGERSTIRQKLEDLGVLKPQSNALIPTNQTSNAVVPYKDPVMTPPTRSEISNALAKMNGPVGTAIAIGKELADLNAAWGNPVGRFGRWVGKKLKKGAKKLVKKFSKNKETKVPAIEGPPAIEAPPAHNDVVDPVVQQERNIISSATVYPQMLPAALYKPTKWFSARAYESMLPRRRYRRGMFGHNVYNNMGFFNSFVSPSNRRFYF